MKNKIAASIFLVCSIVVFILFTVLVLVNHKESLGMYYIMDCIVDIV